MSRPTTEPRTCNVFWGSHGCDLPYKHPEPIHKCHDCYEYNRETQQVRSDHPDEREWFYYGPAFTYDYWRPGAEFIHDKPINNPEATNDE